LSVRWSSGGDRLGYSSEEWVLLPVSISVIRVIDVAFEVLVWLIIIRCILSFVRHDPYQPVFKFIYDVTEPVMAPFRRLVPVVGGLDFSPLIAIMVVELVRRLVYAVLVNLIR